MNEYNEQISALMDDEHNGENRALDKLITDQAMQDTWLRYHLIGDCLRGHLPDQISSDISTHVHNALEYEPTILAPQKSKRISFKPIAGFAIAASVAMLAVFGIQRSNHNNTLPESAAIAANKVITPVAEPQSFAFTEPPVLPAAVKKSDTPTPSIANQRMNSYLVNYNEYRSNGGMNGILPYVRIVTIEPQE